MTSRSITAISIVVIALLVAPALPAFQAAPGTTALGKSKKAPKVKANAAAKPNSTADKAATKRANSKVASEATTTVNKSRKALGHKVPKEKAGAVGEVAAPTTDTARRGNERARRAPSESTGTADRVHSSAADSVSTTRSVPAATVSNSEIAAAKASGEVWVNTETGVYHKGGRWYGTTKQGKFMSEQEAVKAGYHAAKMK